MENREQEIRNKITVISFVCSILVIYIHTYNLEVYGIDSTAVGVAKIVYMIEEYWSKVLHVAVPMFFFISGILFYRNFEIDRLFDKWKKRLFTVVVPYILWSTIYYLYSVVCTNVPIIRAHMSAENVVNLSFDAWIGALWNDSYYTLWFLKNLIIFIALVPIIWLLLKNHWKQMPTGLIVLVVMEVLIKGKGENLGIPYLSGMDVYLTGSYIGLNCSNMLNYTNKRLSKIAVIYIMFMLLTDFAWWNIITQIATFVAIWFACDLLNLGSRSLPWWMSITFFTYVAHDAILEAFEKVFLIGCGTYPICALVDYVFMPLVVLLFLIIVAYIMQRFLPVVWKLCTGDRGKMRG